MDRNGSTYNYSNYSNCKWILNQIHLHIIETLQFSLQESFFYEISLMWGYSLVGFPQILSWLVVLTILKNMSQWEGLSHILWNIKNVWNHQPVLYLIFWGQAPEYSSCILPESQAMVVNSPCFSSRPATSCHIIWASKMNKSKPNPSFFIFLLGEYISD